MQKGEGDAGEDRMHDMPQAAQEALSRQTMSASDSSYCQQLLEALVFNLGRPGSLRLGPCFFYRQEGVAC